jgi:NADPH:quinone reductase-like Zn-dependent oxidoreductase
MKAAVLRKFGTPPELAEFHDPVAGPGEVELKVLAAGINHLDLGKASGRFYGSLPPLPFVVGTDGIGEDASGRRSYFDASVAPFGALGERTLVHAQEMIPVLDGVPNATAAALGNAGVAAMTSLAWRGQVQRGDAVLILGAAGAVGHIAVQVARHLGAETVVAVGRDAARLRRIEELGADVTLTLPDAAEQLTGAIRSAVGEIDVFLDLLWGPPAVAALGAAAHGARFVQIGSLAALDATIPSRLLRSRMVALSGISGFRIPAMVRSTAYQELCGMVVDGKLEVDVETLPLAEVATAWRRQREHGGKKIVVIP